MNVIKEYDDKNKVENSDIKLLEPKNERRNTLNLKDLKNLKNQVNLSEDKIVKETNVDEPIQHSSYSIHDLNILWSEFSEKLKNEGKTSQFIILDRPITLNEHLITLYLDNLIQIDQLNVFKSELLEFLRKKLKNGNISLETLLVEESQIKKIYTSREKFQYLANKYPLLEDLKNRLGLETDF